MIVLSYFKKKKKQYSGYILRDEFIIHSNVDVKRRYEMETSIGTEQYGKVCPISVPTYVC